MNNDRKLKQWMHRVELLSEENKKLKEYIKTIEKENNALQNKLAKYEELKEKFDAIFAECRASVSGARKIHNEYKQIIGDLMLQKKEYDKQVKDLLSQMSKNIPRK